MGQACRICTSGDRLEIERGILRGVPRGKIAEAFGVSERSIGNHAANHLSRQLLKADEMRSMAEASNLAGEIDSLIQRTKRILDRSERDGLHLVSLRAISELRASFAFMVSTAYLLRQDEREEAAQQRREEIEDLKERFDVEELELLREVLAKRADQRLVAVRIIDRESHHPEGRSEREPAGGRFPPINIDSF
jgi:hypothetical protein